MGSECWVSGGSIGKRPRGVKPKSPVTGAAAAASLDREEDTGAIRFFLRHLIEDKIFVLVDFIEMQGMRFSGDDKFCLVFFCCPDRLRS